MERKSTQVRQQTVVRGLPPGPAECPDLVHDADIGTAIAGHELVHGGEVQCLLCRADIGGQIVDMSECKGSQVGVDIIEEVRARAGWGGRGP